MQRSLECLEETGNKAADHLELSIELACAGKPAGYADTIDSRSTA
jgi:hypothetical protein